MESLDRIRLVWSGGFPRGAPLVASDGYLLTIGSLEVTTDACYGTIRAVLVRDGEYACWQEACEQEALVVSFSRRWDSVEWQEEERTLVCGFFIRSGLSRKEQENLLLEQYGLFLTEAGIGPVTPDLVPEVEWFGSGP